MSDWLIAIVVKHLVKFMSKTIWYWTSLCRYLFKLLDLLVIIGLFEFLLFLNEFASFVTKTLSVTTNLSNILAYNCLEYSTIVLFIFAKSLIILFHSWFSYLSLLLLLLFLLLLSLKVCQFCSVDSNNQLLLSLVFSVIFLFSIPVSLLIFIIICSFQLELDFLLFF